MLFSIEYINIPTLIAILIIAYLMDDVFLFMKLGNDTTKQLNDFFGEFWKENIGKEEKKQPIYFTFVIFCRRTDSLLAKQILEEANGLLMYRNRYRLGAIFSEKEYKLNIKQVSPKSHYKDIYRKMSGELRRFAGGYTEI